MSAAERAARIIQRWPFAGGSIALAWEGEVITEDRLREAPNA